jgi:hypothetical protein
MPTFDEQRQEVLDNLGRELGPDEGLLDGLATDGAYLALVVRGNKLNQTDIRNLIGGHPLTVGPRPRYQNFRHALKRVRVPSNVHTIVDLTFDDCVNLEDAFIPSGVRVLENNAFYGCTSLYAVNVEAPQGDADGLRVIKASCFEACSKLRSIQLPSTVTTIGESAFERTALRIIRIPAGVRDLEANVFRDCTSLIFLFFARGSELRRIHVGAFDSSGLKRIDIPQKVEHIETSAFLRCPWLSVVKFAKDAVLESIGHHAFHLTAVRRIRIPRSVTFIGRRAFPRLLRVVYIEGRDRTYENVRALCGVDVVVVLPPEERLPFGDGVRLVLCDTKEPFQVARGPGHAELHEWVFPQVRAADYGVIMPGFRTLGLRMRDMGLLNDSEVSLVASMAASEVPWTDWVAEAARAAMSDVPFALVLDQRPGSDWFDM